VEKNLKVLSDEIVELPHNFLVESIDDHCVRIAVTEDHTYPLHKHPNSDELFVVLEESLVIEFSNRDRDRVSLKSGDYFRVAVGRLHRTIAIGRTVNVCFDSIGAETIFPDAKAEL